MFLALWWPFCSGCFVSSCVVGGHSDFVSFSFVSWVFWAVTHSDWSSWAVGSSATALRSHVVPGCSVVALISLTWCTEFFCGSNSCCSCSIIAAVVFCCFTQRMSCCDAADFVCSSGSAVGCTVPGMY